MRATMFVRLVVALCISLTTIVAAGNAHAATPQNGEDAPHLRVGKWIEVVVADQQLNAWEDGRIVMTTPISTGVRKTPTPRGTFKIYSKYSRARMRGPGYDLPNVPYVMYFKGSYGIHGTYWHNNFGRPMSHGCVNMPTSTAAWLFQWAPKGTSVVVR